MDRLAVPARLEWLRATADGRDWLAGLPAVVAACAERWSLQTGAPYELSNVSLALPARRADGSGAVLKIQFPGRESEHEAAALACWNGDGAVLLLDHDAAMHALLLEQCVPGTHLSALPPADALGVLIELLPRLWKAAPDAIGTLRDEAAWWAGYLPDRWERAGRPFERRLLDAAMEALTQLPGTQGEQVLLHQDLHADNVLRAQREPWLVIDPKPLVGEREFGLAPIVRSTELGHSEQLVVERLDRLCSDLGLDRERARGWTIGQTLAWGFGEHRVHERHIETVRWLVAAA